MRSPSRHAQVICHELLAARIKRLSGYSGASLAQAIGIPAGRLAAIANGARARPDEEKLMMMALHRYRGDLSGLTGNTR